MLGLCGLRGSMTQLERQTLVVSLVTIVLATAAGILIGAGLWM